MAIDHVFRNTPQLGPALIAHDSEFWFNPAVTNTNDDVDVSPMLGTVEYGTDGHRYILVEAGADLNANDDVAIDETTFVATLGAGTDPWEVSPDIEGGAVTTGEYFWARRDDLL